MKTCKPIDKSMVKSKKCTTWGEYAGAGGCAENCTAGLKAMIKKSLCDKPPPLNGTADSEQEAAQEAEGGGKKNAMDCMKTCKPIDKSMVKSKKCTTWGEYAGAGGCAETCTAGLKAMIKKSLCDKPPPLKGPANSSEQEAAQEAEGGGKEKPMMPCMKTCKEIDKS